MLGKSIIVCLQTVLVLMILFCIFMVTYYLPFVSTAPWGIKTIAGFLFILSGFLSVHTFNKGREILRSLNDTTNS